MVLYTIVALLLAARYNTVSIYPAPLCLAKKRVSQLDAPIRGTFQDLLEDTWICASENGMSTWYWDSSSLGPQTVVFRSKK